MSEEEMNARRLEETAKIRMRNATGEPVERDLWHRIECAMYMYGNLLAEREKVASGKVTCEDCGQILARF